MGIDDDDGDPKEAVGGCPAPPARCWLRSGGAVGMEAYLMDDTGGEQPTVLEGAMQTAEISRRGNMRRGCILVAAWTWGNVLFTVITHWPTAQDADHCQ